MRTARLLLLTFLLVLMLGLGALLGWLGARGWSPGRPRTWEGPAIVTQIQALSELATVRYVIEKIVLAEDVKPYGQSRVVLVAHGIVKAGVDLTALTPGSIAVHGDQLTLTLPAPRILDAYLDDEQTRVLDHSTGLLRRFNKNLEQTARRKGLAAVREAARRAGILEEARTRARLELTRLLGSLGFTRVTIQFAPVPESSPSPE